MVRSNKTRDSDPPAPDHSSLPTLKGGHPCDAALKPVDQQGQPAEVREPPTTAREEPIHLRKEQARLRKERARLRGEPPGLRTAAARGPQPKETGSRPGASAARQPPWIAARSVHG
jgi:hypothetical protein